MPPYKQGHPITVGVRARKSGTAKNLTLRALVPKAGVGFTYLSMIESCKLDFGVCRSGALVRKPGKVLDADRDGVVLPAQTVPNRIRERVLARPDGFQRLAELSDRELNTLLAGSEPRARRNR